MTNPKRCRGSISGISLQAAHAALALVVLVVAIVATQPAEAQTFTVLHSFTGYTGYPTDGARPEAVLVQDAAGNLYGTTYSGGTHNEGTVFEVSATGKETLLHSFGYSDGAFPYAGLIRDGAGNLYGTTYYGGSSGYGIVFKLSKTGKETVLHNFTGSSSHDGAYPRAGVILDAQGNLCGTTYQGGLGYGTVFKVSKAGKETVLHSFAGGPSDGEFPYGGLVQDAAGNLYGTTYYGGNYENGTVFKANESGVTVLYNFTGSPDGQWPYGGLIRDRAGDLYGTTYKGGTYDEGTVFELSKAGKETVLHSFTYSDGAFPYAGLIRDTAGNFYGTTSKGGSFAIGTVFELSGSGKETVLYNFVPGGPGEYPIGGVIRDAQGNLYGTTSKSTNGDYGTVWKLTP